MRSKAHLLIALACLIRHPASAQSPLPPLPAEIPATADQYSVLIMGNPAGQQAVWTTPDGVLHIFFQFNDRGRGPQTTSTIKLDGSGVPVSETVTGHNYLKSPVTENYTQDAGVAHWNSESEHGETKITTPAVYLALNGAPAEIGLLARVALDHGSSIPLLPEGEAKIDKLKSLTISAARQSKQVTLYAITGLDFSPVYIWLDDRRSFFASVDPWSTVIPQAWQSAVQTLQNAQDEAAHAHAADLARRLAHPTPQGIVFQHANVFDAEHAELRRDTTVLVIGNRIRSVGPSSQAVAPTGAEIIDGTGKTLLPGLWDMHAHVGDSDGMLNLAAGVTTVRDLGNDIDTLLARRKRIEEGQEIGTRIVLAGLIDGPGPYQGPTKVLVSTPDEARAAVDNYIRLGYVQIKIYSSVKPELVPLIIQEAHRHGLRVSGHIPAQMTAAQCIELGYDEVQHANFLMLNFMPDVKNTNSTSRFTEVAKRGADLDLSSLQFQSFIALLQQHHTVLDPTLSIFEDMFDDRTGQTPEGYRPVFHRLPPQVRRALLTGNLTPPPGMDEQYRRSFNKMVEMVRLFYRAGIPIEAGTDSTAGFALHRELELDVEAGIPANKVLQNATLNAARIMKLDADLGSIAPGKLADLTLVNGDPLTNIRDIRNTAMVVKNGVIYKPEELYSALGVTPAHDAPSQQANTTQPPSPPPSGAASVTIEENIPYGTADGAPLLLDIYKPATPRPQPQPAILLIHGGGWTSLDKSTMRRMGEFLARSGFVAFAANYRLFENGENRWPAQLDDVQRAVRWVRANAAKYNVNPDRIGAFGHSAGAQLAALLGEQDTRDNSDPTLAKYSSKVQAVVDVDGPTDFTTERSTDGLAFLADFFGASLSNRPEIWRQASPALHVSPGDAPFLIVHGTEDQSVPLSQAEELFDKLQSAGVPVSFIKVNDEHTFKTADARRQLAVETLAFFDHYLMSPQ